MSSAACLSSGTAEPPPELATGSLFKADALDGGGFSVLTGSTLLVDGNAAVRSNRADQGGGPGGGGAGAAPKTQAAPTPTPVSSQKPGRRP